MRFLLCLLAAAFAAVSPAMIGDLGFMLGVQEICDDLFCQTGHISLMNYTFPPPAFDKGTELVAITASYPALTIQSLGRYTSYDPNTGRYFLLTEIQGSGEEDYVIYTVNVVSLKVTFVTVPQAGHMEVTSIQYDYMNNTLYAVFDASMYTLDPTTGTLVLRGPLNGGNSQVQLEPGLCTTYDSTLGYYFISVDDEIQGTHKLLTYNTRANTIMLTPNLNNGDYWTLYGMGYDPALQQLVALTNNLRGYPSVKLVNYITGNHTDLIPEYIWGDYDYAYSLWPLSPTTQGLTQLDMKLNIFWMTVMWLEPSSEADDDALVYYNLTKGGIEMGSGPMVVYDNAIEFTNYVWFPYPPKPM